MPVPPDTGDPKFTADAHPDRLVSTARPAQDLDRDGLVVDRDDTSIRAFLPDVRDHDGSRTEWGDAVRVPVGAEPGRVTA